VEQHGRVGVHQRDDRRQLRLPGTQPVPLAAQRRRDVRQTKRNHATDAMQPNSAFDPQEFATTFIDTEFDNLPWYSRLLVRACLVRARVHCSDGARQRLCVCICTACVPAPTCVHPAPFRSSCERALVLCACGLPQARGSAALLGPSGLDGSCVQACAARVA
jgi:hypothetical protein